LVSGDIRLFWQDLFWDNGLNFFRGYRQVFFRDGFIETIFNSGLVQSFCQRKNIYTITTCLHLFFGRIPIASVTYVNTSFQYNLVPIFIYCIWYFPYHSSDMTALHISTSWHTVKSSRFPVLIWNRIAEFVGFI
jgi:hypothetical protein